MQLPIQLRNHVHQKEMLRLQNRLSPPNPPTKTPTAEAQVRNAAKLPNKWTELPIQIQNRRNSGVNQQVIPQKRVGEELQEVLVNHRKEGLIRNKIYVVTVEVVKLFLRICSFYSECDLKSRPELRYNSINYFSTFNA